MAFWLSDDVEVAEAMVQRILGPSDYIRDFCMFFSKRFIWSVATGPEGPMFEVRWLKAMAKAKGED